MRLFWPSNQHEFVTTCLRIDILSYICIGIVLGILIAWVNSFPVQAGSMTSTSFYSPCGIVVCYRVWCALFPLPWFGFQLSVARKIFMASCFMRIFCLPRKTFQSSIRFVFHSVYFFVNCVPDNLCLKASLKTCMKSTVSCLTFHCSSSWWLLVKGRLRQKNVSVLIPSLSMMMMIRLKALMMMIMRS